MPAMSKIQIDNSVCTFAGFATGLRQSSAGPLQFITCTKCKIEKPASEFSPNRRKSNGRSSHCKECHREYNSLYTQSHKDHLAAYSRAYFKTPRGKEVRSRSDRKQYQLHPKRGLAHYVVHYAIKKGELSPLRLSECVMCGGEPKHYHHWSYEPEHWLDVIPVCISCHNEIHKARAYLPSGV